MIERLLTKSMPPLAESSRPNTDARASRIAAFAEEFERIVRQQGELSAAADQDADEALRGEAKEATLPGSRRARASAFEEPVMDGEWMTPIPVLTRAANAAEQLGVGQDLHAKTASGAKMAFVQTDESPEPMVLFDELGVRPELSAAEEPHAARGVRERQDAPVLKGEPPAPQKGAETASVPVPGDTSASASSRLAHALPGLQKVAPSMPQLATLVPSSEGPASPVEVPEKLMPALSKASQSTVTDRVDSTTSVLAAANTTSVGKTRNLARRDGKRTPVANADGRENAAGARRGALATGARQQQLETKAGQQSTTVDAQRVQQAFASGLSAVTGLGPRAAREPLLSERTPKSVGPALLGAAPAGESVQHVAAPRHVAPVLKASEVNNWLPKARVLVQEGGGVARFDVEVVSGKRATLEVSVRDGVLDARLILEPGDNPTLARRLLDEVRTIASGAGLDAGEFAFQHREQRDHAREAVMDAALEVSRADPDSPQPLHAQTMVATGLINIVV